MGQINLIYTAAVFALDAERLKVNTGLITECSTFVKADAKLYIATACVLLV